MDDVRAEMFGDSGNGQQGLLLRMVATTVGIHAIYLAMKKPATWSFSARVMCCCSNTWFSYGSICHTPQLGIGLWQGTSACG